MTRKRFVKLLMSHGYDRNEANYRADMVVFQGSTYAGEYERFAYFVTLKKPDWVDDAVRALNEAMPQFVEAFGRMTRAIAAGLSAFNEAYADAMQKGGDNT